MTRLTATAAIELDDPSHNRGPIVRSAPARTSAVIAALASALLFVAPGCRKDSSAPDAGAATAEPAAPQVPDTLQLTLTIDSPELGAVLVAFDEDATPEVPPAQALRVRTNMVLTNYRVRLLDEADRVVPSDDQVRAEPDGLLYEIALLEPLKTGFAYALVVDPQTGPELRDALGRSHPEQRLEFKVAGEREKPLPPEPKKTSRKRGR